MNKTFASLVFTLLALAPLITAAAMRDDYARQWPLRLTTPDAGAYRIVLDADVYRTVQRADLRDLQVVDADGTPIPTALLGAQTAPASPPQWVDVAFFPLQAGDDPAVQDLSVVVRRDTQGNVVSIRNGVALQGGANSTDAAANPSWLIDLGAQAGHVAALQVQWHAYTAPLDLRYRLEGSDDLRDWQVLDPSVHLVDLRNNGYRMQRDRIGVPGAQRYLRLVPLQRTGAPAVASLRAQLQPPVRDDDWQWVTLTPTRVAADGKTFDYFDNGRFPIQRIDVALPGNQIVQWRSLQSRNESTNDTTAWTARLGAWTSYQVADAGQLARSSGQPLGDVVRDRAWQLQSDQPLGSARPNLRLGYRSEIVAFVAQGRPPYALLAGSARASRVDAPLTPLLDALRKQHGADWQPAIATLGVAQTLAGDAALRLAPVPRDWKTWILWTFLVVGAVLVAGIALSLLRERRDTA